MHFRPELLAALQADLSEEENELYEQGHNEALAAAPAVVYQSGVRTVPAGGAGKWKVADLEALTEGAESLKIHFAWMCIAY